MMKTPEKILIHREYQSIENEIRSIENALPYLQHTVEIFNSLGIGNITSEDLPLVVTDVPITLYNIYVDRKVEMPSDEGVFSKNKAKYIEGLDLPNPSEYLAAAGKLRKLIIYTGPSIKYFEIIDNKAAISQSKIEELENQYSKYVESDVELSLHSKLTNLHKVMSDIDDYYFAHTGAHPFRMDRTRIGEAIASNFIKGVPDPDNSFKPLIGVKANFQLIIDLRKELATVK